MTSYKRFTLALLPAVAVRRGRGLLELALVPLVAHSGALGTTAEAICEAAGPALEDVLVDVLGASPGEAAGVVAANDVQGRVVGGRPVGVHHGHQGLLLGLGVVGRLLGHLLGGVKQDQGGGVGPVGHGRHEGRVALGVPEDQDGLQAVEKDRRLANHLEYGQGVGPALHVVQDVGLVAELGGGGGRPGG